MKIKILERGIDEIRFNVSGISIGTANALRRIIISMVPVMAIETVTFYDNSSILADEVLAHRLGLIPLKTDLKTYNFVSECTCKGKGCAKCTAVLTLDVEGPKTVYSKDMKSNDPKIVPVYDMISVVKLAAGQKIKLECNAQLGIGKEHMKWQGGLASYEIKEDKSFDFFIESFGQIPLKEFIGKAFEVFDEQANELKLCIK